MLNNKTDYINIPKLILLSILLSGLGACQPNHSQISSEKKLNPIIGGKPISATNILSKRVIYLSLGVKWDTSPDKGGVSQKGLCTATALSPTILLTAAHCVTGLKPSEVNAVLSNDPWNHPLDLNEWVKVNKIIIHENFSDTTKTKEDGEIHNDLALLQLAQPISEDHISKLAPRKNYESVIGVLSIGYGITTALNVKPPPLSKEPANATMLYYVAKTTEKYDITAPIFSILQSDQSGICSGDSGGPGLIYDENTKDFLIIGVTSYFSINDRETAELDPKGIYNSCIGHGNYMNVLYYADWIERTMTRL